MQAILLGIFGPLLGVVASDRVSVPGAGLQIDHHRLTRGNTMLSLEQISDHLEIEDLLTRYCYAVDDRDWNAYRKVFTADAVIDDTVTGGVRSGLEEHIVYMEQALSKIAMSQHAISTILVDVQGNEARVRAHCSCPMVIDS
ncbi:MAG: nuclear transport factor 2 family protein, partial [Acidobacteriaceae bacterium]|nr:nuclear transport factor 2 family protein [Acidobacteriaceae bacterium]